MAKLGISPPWDIFYNEVEELFDEDPEVHVVIDDEQKTIKLYVENGCKAEALGKIIPEVKKFGNITVRVEVVPANSDSCAECGGNLFEKAFCGNGIVSFVKVVSWLGDGEVTYVVFRNEVIQYFSDNIGDYYGVTSTLAQEIAKDVFENVQGVFFCTDVVRDEECKTGEPLEEWP